MSFYQKVEAVTRAAMKLRVDEIDDAQDRENEMSFIIQVHRMSEQYGENFDEYLDSQLEIVRTEQEDSS